MISYGFDKIQDQINDLQKNKKDLTSFHLETKFFARSFCISKITSDPTYKVINSNKMQLFEHLSQEYNKKDFSECEDYFRGFNDFIRDDIDFGFFIDIDAEIDKNFHDEYFMKKQERINRESSLYFSRVENNQCLCDFESRAFPIALMLDCPACAKPYGEPFGEE